MRTLRFIDENETAQADVTVETSFPISCSNWKEKKKKVYKMHITATVQTVDFNSVHVEFKRLEKLNMVRAWCRG